jgi:hypothetical protein
MVKNYDPNWRYGTHLVKVTLQQWGYKGYVIVTMGGNCKGISVIESSVDAIFDDTDTLKENPINLRYDEEYDIYLCELINEDSSDSLSIEDECENIKDMIVAVEFIDFIKEDN